MVTFFVGQGRMAIESLAVLPVVHALTFLFLSLGLSYQEAAIALAGDRLSNFRPLRNFALGLGALMTLGLSVIAWTPLSAIWFERCRDFRRSWPPLPRSPSNSWSLCPPCGPSSRFSGPCSWSRGEHGLSPRLLPWRSCIILAVLGLTISHFDMIGAVAASVALLVGNASAPLRLLPSFTKALRTRGE